MVVASWTRCWNASRCREPVMAAGSTGKSDTTGVVPTLDELLALRAEVLARTPARRGRSGISGASLSPLRGRGMEYAESREYAAGDDARHIDWRLTARTGRPHTKLFQAERERLTLLLADTSPALFFGTRARFKSVQLARLGAVAAWSALRDGDRLAAIAMDPEQSPMPPAGGMRGALRVMDALARWYAGPGREGASPDAALARARPWLRPGSRAVLLAGADSLLEVPQARWLALTRHVETHALVVIDPFEQAPPRERLPFITESGRIDLALGAEAVRARWNARFSAPLESVRERLEGAGVHVHAVPVDADATTWLPGFRAAQSEVA